LCQRSVALPYLCARLHVGWLNALPPRRDHVDTSPSMVEQKPTDRFRAWLKLDHLFLHLITPQPQTERAYARVTKKPQEQTFQNELEATRTICPRFKPHRHVFHFLFFWHRKVIELIKSTIPDLCRETCRPGTQRDYNMCLWPGLHVSTRKKAPESIRCFFNYLLPAFFESKG